METNPAKLGAEQEVPLTGTATLNCGEGRRRGGERRGEVRRREERRGEERKGKERKAKEEEKDMALKGVKAHTLYNTQHTCLSSHGTCVRASVIGTRSKV